MLTQPQKGWGVRINDARAISTYPSCEMYVCTQHWWTFINLLKKDLPWNLKNAF